MVIIVVNFVFNVARIRTHHFVKSLLAEISIYTISHANLDFYHYKVVIVVDYDNRNDNTYYDKITKKVLNVDLILISEKGMDVIILLNVYVYGFIHYHNTLCCGVLLVSNIDVSMVNWSKVTKHFVTKSCDVYIILTYFMVVSITDFHLVSNVENVPILIN